MQLLVFGNPEFFTRWEVVTAESLDQAMELATETNPKNITEASELFRTIQELTQKNKVTQIAVNSSVRNRLAEIIRLAPQSPLLQSTSYSGKPEPTITPQRLSSSS